MFFVLSFIVPEAHGDVNYTIIDDAHTVYECSYPLPSASANGTMVSIGNLIDDVYVVDETSAPLERTRLSLKARPGVNYGSEIVSIEEYAGTSHLLPPGIKDLRLPDGDVSMGVFVIVDAPGEVEWGLLKVKYTPEDFPADIAEESIHLAGYNQATDEWVRLRDSPDWASDGGVDVDNHYAWANVTRFGTFGLMGGGMADYGIESTSAESKVGFIVFPLIFAITLFTAIRSLWK